MIRRAILVAALVAAASAARATESWHTAPLYGADVRSLAIDPRNPDRILAGTSAGQIYRSDDGGANWGAAGAPLPFPGWVAGSLGFDPNRPTRLWASLWGIWGGGLVAWSEDFGRTWAVPHPVREDEQVYALALVPGRTGVLFAGTRRGVYKSTDDGANWIKVSGSYPEMENVSSLYVEALAPDTVIAGTWHRAYRTDDGGVTWRGIFNGMFDDTEVFSLQPVPWKAGEVWASTCGWVYRTGDLGEKWTRYKDGFSERRTPSFAAACSPARSAACTPPTTTARTGGGSPSRISPCSRWRATLRDRSGFSSAARAPACGARRMAATPSRAPTPG
jgi:photosystem II stability/assembly factor-like uncharacterized protein